jgi:hypothetical protein
MNKTYEIGTLEYAINKRIEELALETVIEFVSNPIANDWRKSLWQDTSHKWRVTFKTGDTIDFYTGIGHREPKGFKEDKKEFYRLLNSCSHLTKEGFKKLLAISKPVPPSFKDILYSLVTDAYALETSFKDWASGFGCSDDSISARDTYFKCQENGIKLRKLGLNIAELQTFFQDY